MLVQSLNSGKEKANAEQGTAKRVLLGEFNARFGFTSLPTDEHRSESTLQGPQCGAVRGRVTDRKNHVGQTAYTQPGNSSPRICTESTHSGRSSPDFVNRDRASM